MRLELKLPKSDEIDQLIEENELDEMGYDNRWGNYRIRINKGEINKKNEVIRTMLEKVEQNFNS